MTFFHFGPGIIYVSCISRPHISMHVSIHIHITRVANVPKKSIFIRAGHATSHRLPFRVGTTLSQAWLAVLLRFLVPTHPGSWTRPHPSAGWSLPTTKTSTLQTSTRRTKIWLRPRSKPFLTTRMTCLI